MKFQVENNALIYHSRNETLRIEPWGKDALRVRATQFPQFTGEAWALTEPPADENSKDIINKTAKTDATADEQLTKTDATADKQPAKTDAAAGKQLAKEGASANIQLIDGPVIEMGDVRLSLQEAVIANGRIKARINAGGVLFFYRDDKLILQEYSRNYFGCETGQSACLKVTARTWKPIIGGDYGLTVRFCGNDDEKIYGMGQYQQSQMNLKGCNLELAQRNSQVSVPFAVSNLGYGFLWNNPAVGRASFGCNYTEWVAEATKEMDYWITVGDGPAEILKNYTAVTGRAPVMPQNLLGLWQCKLRYRTQEEVLSVARRYKELGIPLEVIVIDFFHWTRQGDWQFDPEYWPDPKAMCDELHAMGTKVMVSVWPTVDKKSFRFRELEALGLLVRTEHGTGQIYDYEGDCSIIDVTNPVAQQYLWNACKASYADLGIDFFWLDNIEPDLGTYDFENIRYYTGPGLEVSGIYPQLVSKAFTDGMKAAGKENFVHLARCGWAGNQKYPALIWSGDVPSTFEALRDQIAAGQNMGLAGIPWWTTDIGGFQTENCFDPSFTELLLRWYEFAVYSPVLRMHGNRAPYDIPPLSDKESGGGYLYTGHDNELWSYGEEAFGIMKDQLDRRLALKPYIAALMEEAHETGAPLIRPMFWEFPEDPQCWELPRQYMFGSDYLVAPVLAAGARSVRLYLPAGTWDNVDTKERFEGGRWVDAQAPLERIPVFQKVINGNDVDALAEDPSGQILE